MDHPNVVIVSGARTPIGSFGGALSSLPAPRLGAVVVREVIRRAGVAPDEIDQVIMGCVLSSGLGQAPARQAALFAGLPDSVETFTVNKVCGSGLKAVMLAAQAIMTGEADAVVAGGMESMSNAPYLLEKARRGYRLGHGRLTDSLMADGLWDVYNDFHMGSAAEICARECVIPREAQDDFSRLSYERAIAAQKNGSFDSEIVPVTLRGSKGEEVTVRTDEEPGNTRLSQMGTLKAAFQQDGTVTAANSSKISDGAAALLVMSEKKSKDLGLKPMVRIAASSSTAKKPEWFTTAPVDAIEKVLKKAGLTKEDIGLWEINEAFAVVTLAVNNILGLDIERVNVNGGAVALGHPIGATGARILLTLINAMISRKVGRGVAAICIGGGEASAMIVEQ